MPELPEVEVVRVGVSKWAVGRTIGEVEVLHPRATRRHVGGPTDFHDRLRGAQVVGTGRRGKYLWLTLGSGDLLVAHLGMSGQFRVQEADAPNEPHLRIRLRFADTGPQLRFLDQRTFGGMFVDEPTDTDVEEDLVPGQIGHLARDLFDPHLDIAQTARLMRRSKSPVKAVLLNQSVVSGVGNIYADEALWRAKLRWSIPADRVSLKRLSALLVAARDVMTESLSQGGTSFDSLYVNVNGSSGYFSHSLAAYGQEGLGCPRCGTPIKRERFANRSSFRCPCCQR